MVKQKCVRTYELYCGKNTYLTKNNCNELNDCLNNGWKSGDGNFKARLQ